MNARKAALVALAMAVTLTSVAAAGPDATKQRVAITSKGVLNASGFGKFALTPLGAGALELDAGTLTGVWPGPRVLMRGGQRVEIVGNVVETYKGKRGTIVIGSRVEWVDAANGYHIGTGTWKVARGTGEYAGVAGGGRSGNVWVEHGRKPWSSSYEGFLSLP